MKNTNKKVKNVTPELKQVQTREVVIQSVALDQSDHDRFIVRARVFGNRYHNDWIQKHHDLDVLMKADQLFSYQEFKKAMLQQFAILPCVPEVAEFEGEPIGIQAWNACMFHGVSEYNEVTA